MSPRPRSRAGVRQWLHHQRDLDDPFRYAGGAAGDGAAGVSRLRLEETERRLPDELAAFATEGRIAGVPARPTLL